MTPDILTVDGLTKRFGGLVVTSDLSLTIREGEIHAIIGPNGAGKTTFISQLQGTLRPDHGRIVFEGTDITHTPIHRRARMGLARSFQISSIFPRLTVLQNVILAVQAHEGHSFHFWSPVEAGATLNAKACAALDHVGIMRIADTPAGEIAYSEQRQLEFAMALAAEPKLLLLDEPMAGMSKDESMLLMTVIQRIKRNVSILLVEHDMDVVFSLADRITVLVRGQAIATGTPEEIRNNADVRAAYLGDE